MKHPFIIFGSLGAVVALGVGASVYFFFFYAHTAPAHTAPNPFSEASSSKGFDAIAAEKAAQAAATTTASAPASNVHLVTLRKTIGAVGLTDGTFRFVESGTGHIYQADSSGVETKLSGTTFPGARSAVWSKEGTRVAITREVDGAALETFNGVVQKNDAGAMTLEGAVVPGTISNVAYNESGDTLYYTRINSLGVTEGVAQNLKTQKTQILFSSPIHDSFVSWEPTIIVTTKPTAALPGFAYTKDNARITDGMNALSTKELGSAVLFSGLSGTSLSSWLVVGGRSVALSRGVIPEKCDRVDSSLVCALPSSFEEASYPDQWNRGEVSYNDSLWLFDMSTGSSTLLLDFEAATQKQIDVRSITVVNHGYLLEGKSDDSLWFVRGS